MQVTFNPNISYKNYSNKKAQNPAFGQVNAKLLNEMLKDPGEFYNRSGIASIRREIKDGRSKMTLQELKETVLEFLNNKEVKEDPVCWQAYNEEYQELG